MGASSTTGRGPKAAVDLDARSRWAARCDVSPRWARGPGGAECCVAGARPVPRGPGGASGALARARPVPRCSPHRPTLSVAEARSPRYPRQTGTSVISNKTDRPQSRRSRRGPVRRSRPRRLPRGNRLCGKDGQDDGPYEPPRSRSSSRWWAPRRYRSAVRQAATVAMTQPATIVKAYVTHQTQMASMTNSSRYVR